MKLLTEYVIQASKFHPTKLDEYLSTKVTISNGFPNKPTVKNIVSWLFENNFTKYNIAGKYDENDELSNDAISKTTFYQNLDDTRFYVARQTREGVLEHYYAISICVGKPNEKNPAVTFFATNRGIKLMYSPNGNRIGYTGNYTSFYNDIKTVDDLKEVLRKYFKDNLEI